MNDDDAERELKQFQCGFIRKKETMGKKPAGKLYRQIIGSDVWHFVPECHGWPTANFRETRKVTSGELCNQCQAKAKKEK